MENNICMQVWQKLPTSIHSAEHKVMFCWTTLGFMHIWLKGRPLNCGVTYAHMKKNVLTWERAQSRGTWGWEELLADCAFLFPSIKCPDFSLNFGSTGKSQGLYQNPMFQPSTLLFMASISQNWEKNILPIHDHPDCFKLTMVQELLAHNYNNFNTLWFLSALY